MLIFSIKVTIKVTFGIRQKGLDYQTDQNLLTLLLCFAKYLTHVFEGGVTLQGGLLVKVFEGGVTLHVNHRDTETLGLYQPPWHWDIRGHVNHHDTETLGSSQPHNTETLGVISTTMTLEY